MSSVIKTYLGLGSNLGDRRRWLKFGLDNIDGVQKVSSVYETEPIGGPEQDNFYNIVVEVDTQLEPEALLNSVLAVEQLAGRKRLVKNGPRTLDIDILLYGDQKIDEPNLIVPHPRMSERNFVIVPLLEIYPAYPLKPVPQGAVDCIGVL